MSGYYQQPQHFATLQMKWQFHCVADKSVVGYCAEIRCPAVTPNSSVMTPHGVPSAMNGLRCPADRVAIAAGPIAERVPSFPPRPRAVAVASSARPRCPLSAGTSTRTPSPGPGFPAGQRSQCTKWTACIAITAPAVAPDTPRPHLDNPVRR